MTFQTFLNILFLLCVVNSTEVGLVTDLLRGKSIIDFTWMEIGFIGLTDTMWYNITTTTTNFRDDRNYSVFLSLPEYGGSTHSDGFPLVSRLRGSPVRNLVDNTLSFEARLIQPNDSACSKQFTIPQPLTEVIPMPWMIVQDGVYNMSGNMFQIDARYMGRDNSVILYEDKPYLYHNRVILNYTSGCYDDDPDEPCHYEPSDPAEINRCDTWFNCEKYWLHLGALTQIQTDINRFDNDTMWLTVRSRNVYVDRIELLMSPHSVGPDSPYYRTYETLVPELVSYFVYEQDVRIRCVEGLHMETKVDYPVTSDAKNVGFYFDYDYPPALFGMLGSLRSVNDAATLRVLNKSEVVVFYITQEDQCYDQETMHTSNESAFSFVVGKSETTDHTLPITACNVEYYHMFPTAEPSAQPTSCSNSGDCDDLIGCTVDTCEEGVCMHDPNSMCDDGVFCNGQEFCGAGSCQSGAPPYIGTGCFCDEANSVIQCGPSSSPSSVPSLSPSVDYRFVNVSTASRLSGVDAVSVGSFNGTAGLFIGVDSTLLFMSGLDVDMQSTPASHVAGGETMGNIDGSFSTALFESVGRALYNASADIAFVCDDRSSIIRIVDFASEFVSTVSSSDNSTIVFLHPSSVYPAFDSGERFPGMELDMVGSYLYVTDRLMVYNLTRDSNSVIASHYVRQSYSTLSEYMAFHNWPSRSFVLGIAVDEERSAIYATISFAVNVLIRIPLHAAHYSEITVLAGNSSFFYEGIGVSTTTPYALDGFGTDSLLAFPSSLVFDASTDELYFAEAFTEFSSPTEGLSVGSLTVRRYTVNTGYVDTYAGVDFSEQNAEYLSSGGYMDGNGTTAQFSYPLSVTYAFSSLGRPVLYVRDVFNDVIRSIYSAMSTIPPPSLEPTGVPTGSPSVNPSEQPSGQPTTQPSGSPSPLPTGEPSGQPSRTPSSDPSALPVAVPTWIPSMSPSSNPSGEPSTQPSAGPTAIPTIQPSIAPSGQPSVAPFAKPSVEPTGVPTGSPSVNPSEQPSGQPTTQPSGSPSPLPTGEPSGQPSRAPSSDPSALPVAVPTWIPSMSPSSNPSGEPSTQPSGGPTAIPTIQSSITPSGQPSVAPFAKPSVEPTGVPTGSPSVNPSEQPSGQPTTQPSGSPSPLPTGEPSGQPSRAPSSDPSALPVAVPTWIPSMSPSSNPSGEPSTQPSAGPTAIPTIQSSIAPSGQPSVAPFAKPSVEPTGVPTGSPSVNPSEQPSGQPTTQPSGSPSPLPTGEPSGQPSRTPSSDPSALPVAVPTWIPSMSPSSNPSGEPSTQPSAGPTAIPTIQSSIAPSGQPSVAPFAKPSVEPTGVPTGSPSVNPSEQPSGQPTTQPSGSPSPLPTGEPSGQPSRAPSSDPSALPVAVPTWIPSMSPSSNPSGEPSTQPSAGPTAIPTIQSSIAPSGQPSVAPFAKPSVEPTGVPTGSPS